MPLYLSSCSECSTEIARAKPATTCSTRCRSRRSDRLRAEAEQTRRDEAAVIAVEIVEGLRGDPRMLARALAEAVDHLAPSA